MRYAETATIVVTHQIKRAIIGTRTVDLPAGFTNANALTKLQPYVRAPSWSLGYAGPTDAAIAVVVIIRGTETWSAAEKRLNAKIAEVNRQLGHTPA